MLQLKLKLDELRGPPNPWLTGQLLAAAASTLGALAEVVLQCVLSAEAFLTACKRSCNRGL
jgi:hypothetical protein